MLFNAQIISDSCFKIINGALLFRRQCSMSLILSRFDINDIPRKLKSVKKVWLGEVLHFIYIYTLCLNEEKVIH